MKRVLFQKRHYLALAQVVQSLREYGDVIHVDDVVHALIVYLSKDNPRFDARRFRDACAQRR